MNPTKRFVIDPLRTCNIKCKFCYYLHSYESWKNHTKSFEQIKSDVDKGILRGNNYMDITGGEPTIYPYICETIDYALSKGVRSCIITNGIVPEIKAEKILNSGINDFLVSRHGLKDTHNFATNYDGAYDKQIEFLTFVRRRMDFRFNCVINKFNQHEILEISKELAIWKPRIVNFINMNPHHEWMDKSLSTKEVIADLNVVQPLLNESIAYLENLGIGVNVRYYPMCKIGTEYRRCICNDLHVVFDPYEWDYDIQPKNLQAFKQWGINASNSVENKGKPCNECNLQGICGGANKYWHKVSNEVYGEVLIPQKLDIDKNDFCFYRKDNILTLLER